MSVYNAEKFLHEAVESILQQTYPYFEFIIIEDASTDGTLRILEEYESADERIILIKNSQNHGAAGFIKNLNRGLEQATGDFIARMDADDISVPDRFEKQLDFLTQNPDILMVGSDLDVIDENGMSYKKLTAPQSDAEIRQNMLKKISLFHPVLMWRNDKKIFYREKMIGCEDYDLYFRLMAEGHKFGNIKETLLKYRILDSSISRKSEKLVRWIFVEKARSFYLERKRTGEDSYENFEPDDFLNILDPKAKQTAENLLFAAKTAVRYQDREGLAIILNKAERDFPNDKRFTQFHFHQKLPAKLSSFLLKISSNKAL